MPSRSNDNIRLPGKKAASSLLCFSFLLASWGPLSYHALAAEVVRGRAGAGITGVPSAEKLPTPPVDLPAISAVISLELPSSPSLSPAALPVTEASAPSAAPVQAPAQAGTPLTATAAAERSASTAAPAPDAARASGDLETLGGDLAAASEAGRAPDAPLSAAFDRARPRTASDAAADPSAGPGPRNLPPSGLRGLRTFIARPGQTTLPGSLGALKQQLTGEPALAGALNRRPEFRRIGRLLIGTFGETGRRVVARLVDVFAAAPVRAVVNGKNPEGGLSRKDSAALAAALDAQGVSGKVQFEKIPVDWHRHAERPKSLSADAAPAAAASSRPGGILRTALRALTWPAREVWFLARAFAASVTAPTAYEVVGALATKTYPFVISVGIWKTSIGTAHPVLMTAAIGLSFFIEAFHGFFLNTWNNLQSYLYRLRGGIYQSNFNWFYGQIYPAAFRTLAWLANPADPDRAHPLTLRYWAAMGPVAVIGPFVGTLAYRGLNTLYENGRINRWQRSFIQQCRDFMMMIEGPLFGSGMMSWYWLMFGLHQAIDIGLFLISVGVPKKPVLYIAEPSIVATKEFGELYPVSATGAQPSALKQAAKSVLDIPLLSFGVVLYRHWQARRRGGARTEPKP